MIITRKIGAILRGKATPFQLAAGCALGAALGFVPGFSIAPGLTVALVFLLVLINANLFLAAIVGMAAKLASWVLLPVSFSIGRLLLDGPLSGLFQSAINTPVLALLGVENYATTGGFVLGLLFGGIISLLVIRGITRFRLRMADATAHSERYKKWNSKAWVRWTVFILAGGGLKDPDYTALAAKKIGNPIRPLGIVFVIVSTVFLVVGFKFFAPTIIKTALLSGLEKANGATVDLESADINLSTGKLFLGGLAITDPNNLSTNLFIANRIEADISGADLLRKRLAIDNLVVDGARLNETRRIAGRIIQAPPEPESDSGWELPDSGELEDYVNNAKVWRERLAQLKSWLDRLNGAPAQNGDPSATSDSWEERLKRIAAERGYAQVNADHLITDSPTLLISNLLADNVKAAWLPNETLSISAKNLSTQPRLVSSPSAITITSSQESVHLAVVAGQTAQLKAHYRGIPADTISASLKQGDSPAPLSGGTIDVALNGTYSATTGTVDWPLNVTLHDTELTIAGRTVAVDHFELPIAIAGSLSSPRIKLGSDQLTRLAKQAGMKLMQEEASKKLSEKAGGLLNGLFGGKEKKSDPPE
jgi:uncharacterized protein (TIGR03546 family)